MPAATYELTIEQGTDFNLFFTWKDSDLVAIDITNYTAAMQVRLKKNSTGTILSLISPTNITLGGVAGTVSVDLSATETGALSFKDAVYDLELTDASSKVTRILEGTVILSKQVTK